MLEVLSLRNDTSSLEDLKVIFNPSNEISCGAYGGGGHCVETRSVAKHKLWGPKPYIKGEDSCEIARIFKIEGEPAAMFNVGKAGNAPTVLDKSSGTTSYVYEFSGLFVVDKFLVEPYKSEIANELHSVLHDCRTEENYTKAIVVFATDHPYQADIFKEAGAVEVNPNNIKQVLGENSMHPERFKFQDNQLLECTGWESGSKINHVGWSESDLCSSWVPKQMHVLGVVEYGFEALDHIEL